MTIFSKIFMDLKVAKTLHINTQTRMLIIAYTHVSVVLVILHYYMLRNKKSHKHSLYSMTLVVVLFAFGLWISWEGTEIQRFYQRSSISILTDHSIALNKMLDKISLHKHFSKSYAFYWVDVCKPEQYL